jgi:hypothetical protein
MIEHRKMSIPYEGNYRILRIPCGRLVLSGKLCKEFLLERGGKFYEPRDDEFTPQLNTFMSYRLARHLVMDRDIIISTKYQHHFIMLPRTRSGYPDEKRPVLRLDIDLGGKSPIPRAWEYPPTQAYELASTGGHIYENSYSGPKALVQKVSEGRTRLYERDLKTGCIHMHCGYFCNHTTVFHTIYKES